MPVEHLGSVICSSLVEIWFNVAGDIAFIGLGVSIALLLSYVAVHREWSFATLTLGLMAGAMIVTGLVNIGVHWFPDLMGAQAISKVALAGLAGVAAVATWVELPGAVLVFPSVSGIQESKEQRRLQETVENTRAQMLHTRHLNQRIIKDQCQILRQIGTVAHSPRALDYRLREIEHFAILLGENGWQGLGIDQIIRRHLVAFKLDKDVVVKGPAGVILTPYQAQWFSVAILELCVNTVQHSQRTQRGARVVVDWRTSPIHLHFSWHEETTDVDVRWKAMGWAVLTQLAPSAFVQGSGQLTYTNRTIDWKLTGNLILEDKPDGCSDLS